MSMLIKGMKMPTKGEYECTIRVWADGTAMLYGNSELIDGGELVPVPSHGRLIDADAFTKAECNNCDGACEALPCDCLNCESDYRCEFMQDIANAPTIIPAEEGNA